MARGLFVTGTDTEVGKTVVAASLVRCLRAAGIDAVGYKPVAAGCELTLEGLRNEDALALLQASGSGDYDVCNPIALEPPIAPHIAAAEVGLKIELEVLFAGYQQLARQHECVVVEGAGGWMTPINDEQGLDDLAAALGLPVVLVVGLRLGCLNHSLLTAQAVRGRGLSLAGWFANQLTADMPRARENIDSLVQRLACPQLGYLANTPNPGALVDESWDSAEFRQLQAAAMAGNSSAA